MRTRRSIHASLATKPFRSLHCTGSSNHIRLLLLDLVLSVTRRRIVSPLASLHRRTTTTTPFLGLDLLDHRLALCAVHLLLLQHVVVVLPQLRRQPNGQGRRPRAFEVHGADIAPAFWQDAARDGLDHALHVGGAVRRRHLRRGDADGGGVGRGQMHDGGVEGAGDLLAQLTWVRGAVAVGALGGFAKFARRARGRFGRGGGGAADLDGDGALAGGAVEDFAECLGEVCDYAGVGEEEVVFGEELAAGFKGLVLGFELAEADDARDAGLEVGGERGLVEALRVGGYEAGGCVGGGDGVGDADFVGFEAGFVGDVFFCGEDELDVDAG